MLKNDFYYKYANAVIIFNKYELSKEYVNDLIFELDNYEKYPKIKSCGLIDGCDNKFVIIIDGYNHNTSTYNYIDIVKDINLIK